jgi:hypothetical protein
LGEQPAPGRTKQGEPDPPSSVKEEEKQLPNKIRGLRRPSSCCARCLSASRSYTALRDHGLAEPLSVKGCELFRVDVLLYIPSLLIKPIEWEELLVSTRGIARVPYSFPSTTEGRGNWTTRNNVCAPAPTVLTPSTSAFQLHGLLLYVLNMLVSMFPACI